MPRFAPFQPPAVPIRVHYDARGGRTCKDFPDQLSAGAFYRNKFKQGKNPRLEKIEQPTQE